jgi:hypothetical protein
MAKAYCIYVPKTNTYRDDDSEYGIGSNDSDLTNASLYKDKKYVTTRARLYGGKVREVEITLIPQD